MGSGGRGGELTKFGKFGVQSPIGWVSIWWPFLVWSEPDFGDAGILARVDPLLFG
jgi:hypothetical protein